jgi:hypothetical protein
LIGFPWTEVAKQEQQKILWELGFNSKYEAWFTDAACFNYNGTQQCGVFIYCSERLDKEWLTKKIDGRSVASLEAKFHKDKDELAIMRGNKTDYTE